MARVFLVRAGHRNKLFPEFLKRGAVSVGWERLGDLSSIQSPAKLESMLRRVYPEGVTASGRVDIHYAEIMDFAIEVQPGDFVATVDGTFGRLVVGRVAGPYIFDGVSPLESGGEPYRHTLPVNWEFAVERERSGEYFFPDTRLQRRTAYWLRPETASAILRAPRLPLTDYPGIAKHRPNPPPRPMNEAPVKAGAAELEEWLADNERRAAQLPLADLAARAAAANAQPRKAASAGTTFVRDSFVAAYAKKAAAGVCGLCDAAAPFATADGNPYLESHHVEWLSRGGADAIGNVVALCPNCHRKMHMLDIAADRCSLKARILERERSLRDS